MTHRITPGQLAVMACPDTQPVFSTVVDEDCQCAMCGVALSKGQPAALFDPPESFTDYLKLADRTSRYLCGYCKALTNRDYLQARKKVVCTPEGLFRAVFPAEIAHFLEHPPQDPYLFLQSTSSNAQHLWWMAPVNFDARVQWIQFGHRRLMIRHAFFVELLGRVRAYIATHDRAPFLADKEFNRDMGQPFPLDFNTKNPPVSELDPQLFQMLMRANIGERWALTRTAWTTEEEARICPERVDLLKDRYAPQYKEKQPKEKSEKRRAKKKAA